MAFVAQVEITVLRLEGFGQLRESVGGCFVLARIGTKLYGRSRLISDGADSFDLTPEPMPWRHELRVESGAELQGSIQVWQDNGDEAPTLAVERTWSVSADDEGEVSIGTEPAVVLEVRPRFAPDLPRIAFVPRVAIGSHGATFATLVSRPSASVTITAVRGLYRPVDVQSTGMHSTSEEGYTSADHQGRVFINRDVDGKWKKGYQAIELEVKVEMLAGRLPPECGVVWTLHGEDDPLNDRLGTHREWGPVLDPGDYDSNGAPTGASGGDIRGVTPASPPWREVAPHTISSITASAVLTTIKDGVSKVRLLCPDQGGDVFSVSADIDPVPGLESFGDRTGVMTMWNRFDVEYVRIAGAAPLLKCFRRVAQAFEPACIQVDFAEEKVAPALLTYDDWKTSRGYDVIVSPTMFSHRQDPGGSW